VLRTALCLLLLSGGFTISCREQFSVVRPGCRLRVQDAETGLPIRNLQLMIIAVYDRTDTVGKWTYITDVEGVATIPSARVALRAEAAAGRKPGHYEYVAVFSGDGYKAYSQRITAAEHLIRLSRGFLIARI